MQNYYSKSHYEKSIAALLCDRLPISDRKYVPRYFYSPAMFSYSLFY